MPIQLYSAPMKYKDQNGDYQNIIGISGNPGRGIASVVLNNDYTLTINFTDNTSTTTGSIRGNGIASIEKTSTAGVVDTYTITDSDGGTSTFTVENGVTPSLSIGTVIEGQAAAATITGTADAPVLNLVLPAANLSIKADKADTVLDTTLSRGRKDNTTVGAASLAFGVDAEASGYYSIALGLNTTAASQGAFAEGKGTTAHYIAHAEGENTEANGQWSHSEGVDTIANGAASHAGGDNTIANGHSSFVTGRYNVADSYDNWPFWAANTTYAVGDKVKREQLVNNEATIVGYICKEANTDESFDISHWDFDVNHMNFAAIVGNGYEAEDPTTHEMVRHGSNAYALDWDGNGYFAGDVYIHANIDSSGGTKLATINDVPVQDVQVNGVSILDAQGVANVPKATAGYNDGTAGVVWAYGTSYGVQIINTGMLETAPATDNELKAGTADFKPVVPKKQHTSTFYGLAKAAGDSTQSASTNPSGTYTPSAKAAIQQMLGISNLLAPSETTTASKAYSIGEVFTSNGKLYKATAAIAAADAIVTQDAGETISESNATEVKLSEYAVRDVQINGTSILANGVANIPVAKTTAFGVVKINSQNGVAIENGTLRTSTAGETAVKSGTNVYLPIAPFRQHEAVFYGLSKVSGTDLANETVTLGIYPDTSKAAIQHMLGTDTNLAFYESDTTSDAAYAIGELFMLNGKLHQATAAIAIGDTLEVGTNCAIVNAAGVFTRDVQVNGTSIVSGGVANVPTCLNGRFGVIRIGATNGWYGLSTDSEGTIFIAKAQDDIVKNGSDSYRSIVPSNQHTAAFYGLAKAAGDTTQSSSSNAVGTYTDNAKASIKSMLGIVDGSTGTVEVTGTTPTITAVENTRYVCGEVSTLSFTPPASGISIVRFTSGTTATVLTLPSTVKFPEWFDATALETDTIYELCITDGIYGAVMSWAL